MLIRNITRTLDIPHEPGNSITIRKMTRKQARKAAEARQGNAIGRIRDLGGAAVMKELRDLKTDDLDEVQKKAEEEAKNDPLAGMDEDAVLNAAIVGWNGPHYEETTGAAMPVSPEAIDLLDEATAKFVAEKAVALYKGTLDGEEVIRGND